MYNLLCEGDAEGKLEDRKSLLEGGNGRGDYGVLIWCAEVWCVRWVRCGIRSVFYLSWSLFGCILFSYIYRSFIIAGLRVLFSSGALKLYIDRIYV